LQLLDFCKGDLEEGTTSNGSSTEPRTGDGINEGGELVQGESVGESELYFELALESEEIELGDKKGGEIAIGCLRLHVCSKRRIRISPE
jgi:hypothetical protein